MMALLRRRDLQESHIDTLMEQQKINKEQYIRIEKGYKEAVENYQVWKKDNKVEGIKY